MLETICGYVLLMLLEPACVCVCVVVCPGSVAPILHV